MSHAPRLELKEPRVRASKQLLIAGLQNHYTAQTVGEIPQIWNRLAPHLGKIPGQVGRTTYGVGFNMGPNGFDYIAGVEVSDASAIPRELSQLIIPAQKYYAFVHEDHVSKIPETITAILNEWVPSSGREIGKFPSLLERYGEGFNPLTGLGDMELWIPLNS